MQLNQEWSSFLCEDIQSNYFQDLNKFIDYKYKHLTIFPEYKDIFRAFNLLTPSEIKVVIIGQDPYHGKDQANGLAFSVSDECKIPPSLKNIFKELVDDTGCNKPKNGNLSSWSKKGVLLINSVLTVEEAKPNSHKDKGWEVFTDSLIEKLSIHFTNLVFILWGSQSQKKVKLIDENKHLVLKAPHPSPLSSYRGFFGSKPFSQTNAYLRKYHKKEINWSLD